MSLATLLPSPLGFQLRPHRESSITHAVVFEFASPGQMDPQSCFPSGNLRTNCVVALPERLNHDQ
jgi:hypothetical protein